MGRAGFADFSHWQGLTVSFRLEKYGKIVYMVLEGGIWRLARTVRRSLAGHAGRFCVWRRIVALKLDRE